MDDHQVVRQGIKLIYCGALYSQHDEKLQTQFITEQKKRRNCYHCNKVSLKTLKGK